LGGIPDHRNTQGKQKLERRRIGGQMESERRAKGGEKQRVT
jgi:hypothetical protein